MNFRQTNSLPISTMATWIIRVLIHNSEINDYSFRNRIYPSNFLIEFGQFLWRGHQKTHACIMCNHVSFDR